MESEYLALVEKLTASSKSEPGILAYSVYQNIHNPSEFLAYEEYESEDALDQHFKTELVQIFMEQSPLWLAKPVDVTSF